MTIQNLGLFQAMGAKMGYLNKRQEVISQNIANSDTPNYRPNDVVAPDFGRVLDKTGKNNVRLETTNAMHMPTANSIQDPKDRKAKETYEVAPAGNSVVMEEQLILSAKTQMDYRLITGLYQKNVSMMRMALGRAQ